MTTGTEIFLVGFIPALFDTGVIAIAAKHR
jgi:hypothetical protein